MNKKLFDELTMLDEERKGLLYLVGELRDFLRWFEDGYKDGDGKKTISLMVELRIGELQEQAESALNFIMFKRKKHANDPD